MKKVAIALGGGGAKFFAHLGMISVLQENKIPIDYLSCSSMGSLVGTLIANEVSVEKIKKESLKYRSRLQWFMPTYKRHGLFSQRSLIKILKKLLPQSKIEKSKIPLSITSVNVLDGKLHIFNKGDIIRSVCASCAFPGLFTPVEFKDKILIDGGLLNNIPADICRKNIGKKNIVISSTLDASMDCKRHCQLIDTFKK